MQSCIKLAGIGSGDTSNINQPHGKVKLLRKCQRILAFKIDFRISRKELIFLLGKTIKEPVADKTITQ